MRILKIKATNKIIEAQSHATEGTLISNALSRGFNASEVEESLVTQEQYYTLINIQNESAKTYSDKRRLEYPTWQDQMDMQYKDLLNGTTTWKDAVAKVKTDNPKE
jgi:hypothetical protein